MRWPQRERREACFLSAMALVRLSGSGFLDLGLLRARPSYRAILLNDLVPLARMAAAEMEDEEDKAAHSDSPHWRRGAHTRREGNTRASLDLTPHLRLIIIK